MKTNFTSLLAAACLGIAAVSCNKSNEPAARPESEPCTLSVSLGGAFEANVQTRVPGSDAGLDNTVESVQIFVFNTGTGRLDASMYKSGLNNSTGTVVLDQIDCTTGSRQVYALVNCPVNYVEGSNAISSVSELQAIRTDLSQNAANSLVMSGVSAVTSLNPGNNSVPVTVSRSCAKVVLKEVTEQMNAPAYRNKVVIKGAYLMNVPGSNYIFGTNGSTLDLAEGSWYAKNTKESLAAVSGLVAETFGSGKSLSNNAKTTFGNTFYTLPNDLTSAAEASWKKCATYLIVEADVAGLDCVYPIRMGAIEANKSYEVSLVLHNVGGRPNEPYKEVEFSNIVPTITVVDWTSSTISQEI